MTKLKKKKTPIFYLMDSKWVTENINSAGKCLHV